MRILAGVIGYVLLGVVLTDAFNTIVMARRTQHGFRVTRAFYRITYRPYAAIARRIDSGSWREAYLGVYGPLSLLGLIALWAVGLIFAFGLMQWSAGLESEGRPLSLFDCIFTSSTTLATLNTGNPRSLYSKLLIMGEGLLGLGFLGLVVGYLPVLYQRFAHREVQISLLDARADSPPSAWVLLKGQARKAGKFEQQLADWEQWAAKMLESHLSYPMLGYFRSHHQNQSWLTAITAVIDASAITVICGDDDLRRQAELTFAMGRHVLSDVASIFRTGKDDSGQDRLPSNQFKRLRDSLSECHLSMHLDRLSEAELRKLRCMYEPSAAALSRHFMMALPQWIPDHRKENWRGSENERKEPKFSVSDPYKD